MIFFVWQLVVMYLDFKQDESYTPSNITIRAGDGFHNMKVLKLFFHIEFLTLLLDCFETKCNIILLPYGFNYVFSHAHFFHCFLFEILIVLLTLFCVISDLTLRRKDIKTVELVQPTGWVYISLSRDGPR